MLPGFTGMVAGLGNPITIVATVEDLTTRTGSYTFNNVSLGPDYTNRTIIVVTLLYSSANATLNVSTVTIAGGATVGSDTGERNVSLGSAGAGIFAGKPTGTSGTIVVNFSTSAAEACRIVVISVATTSTTPTATYNITPSGSGRSSESSTINTLANGVVIEALARSNNATATVTGDTERSNAIFDTNARVVVSFDESLPANASRPVGWTSGTSAPSGFIVKSYPN